MKWRDLATLEKVFQQSEEEVTPADSNDRRKKLQLRYTTEEKNIFKLLESRSFLYHLDIQLKKDCLLKGARAL